MAFVVVVVVVVVVAVAVNALPNVGGTRHEPHETHTRARHAPAKDPEGDNGLVLSTDGTDGGTGWAHEISQAMRAATSMT